MKQTAVEWLQQALMTKEDADNYNQWAFNKANAMEKEQIAKAYDCTNSMAMNGEQYYNKTFKSE